MNLFTTKPPSPFLLSLPPELREQIFILALSSPEKPTVTFRLDRYQRDGYVEAAQPHLTRVSRQIRREALPLFYSETTFVLHTEGSKLADGEGWLHYSQPHLPKLGKLEVWVRYVAPANDRGLGSGALSLSVQHDAWGRVWRVADEWRWVTANRKPADVEKDGGMLVRFLREMIEGRRRDEMCARDYVTICSELKKAYLEIKIGDYL